MTARGPLLALLLIALAGAALALVEGPGAPASLAPAFVAVFATAAVSGSLLADRLDRPRHEYATIPVDPIGRLRGILRPRSIGRERAIFALQALEFASGSRNGSSWSPEELRTMFGWSSEEFAAWLKGRLDRLEQGT